MKIWRHSRLDVLLAALSVGHLTVMVSLAVAWNHVGTYTRLAFIPLLVFLIFYQIIVVAHLFTHCPWFVSATLNRLASMLNSINIGQSAQAYHLTHVRNHHRYNNRKNARDAMGDLSSTFLKDRDGEHASLFRYAFVGGLVTLLSTMKCLLGAVRLWPMERDDGVLVSLTAPWRPRRDKELLQVRRDRFAHLLAVASFLAVSWQWTVFCYFPSLYLAFVLVNIQNYYEHYGAVPENRYANSVSYYGFVYNLIMFNDGYHQEHHIQPQAHWARLPQVRRELAVELDGTERVVSPFPAVLGFLHRTRPLLHRALL